MYGVIYLITNLINGKQYIGQTVNNGLKRWVDAMARPEIHDKLVANGLEVQTRPEIKEMLANPEYREHHRQLTIAGFDKPGVRQRIGEATKNTIWINDGTQNRRQSNKLLIPSGWVAGMLTDAKEVQRRPEVKKAQREGLLRNWQKRKGLI